MKKVWVTLLCFTLIYSMSFAAGGKDGADKASVQLRFLDVNPGPARQEYYTKAFAQFKDETGI